MSLACQKNSYLKEFQTTVKSCEQTEDGRFEIVLEDTILFPEGGGQPDDRGKIADVEVLGVRRRGAEAVHLAASGLAADRRVDLRLDWARRWDHMQQHSAQHLVTAIVQQQFGYNTTSWDLGREKTAIELDTAQMAADQAEQAERLVNQAIQDALPVNVRSFQTASDPKLNGVRTRGLPEDHKGAVRLVEIQGVEDNMCCGTHVSNLSHLQAVKILGVEKGKKKKTNLIFVAGERVLRYLGKLHGNEKAFNNLLNCGIDEHVLMVEKIQKSSRELNKSNISLLKEIAKLEVERLKLTMGEEDQKVVCIHRRDGNQDYMNIIAKEMGRPDIVLLVTTGEDKGPGQFILTGPDQFLQEISARVFEVIDGKGAIKNGRCQGKASKLQKRKEAEKILKEAFQQ